MDTPKYLTGLEDLHDLLVDSQKGYAEAAERAEEPGIKAVLEHLSEGRSALIAALLGERRTLDSAYTPHNGTLKGDLHRAWMDMRDAMSTSGNGNVLSECERGENYLLERYTAVLDEGELPSGLRGLLVDQENAVRANLDTVRSLRTARAELE